jgi:hypothetical protein
VPLGMSLVVIAALVVVGLEYEGRKCEKRGSVSFADCRAAVTAPSIDLLN